MSYLTRAGQGSLRLDSELYRSVELRIGLRCTGPKLTWTRWEPRSIRQDQIDRNTKVTQRFSQCLNSVDHPVRMPEGVVDRLPQLVKQWRQLAIHSRAPGHRRGW